MPVVNCPRLLRALIDIVGKPQNPNSGEMSDDACTSVELGGAPCWRPKRFCTRRLLNNLLISPYQPPRILRVYIIAVLESRESRCSMYTVQATRPAVHPSNAPIRQACR